MNKIKSAFYLFFPILIGGIVGLLINSNIDYAELVKPTLAPPKIAFPIAWTIIYLLMGISYYLLKRNNLDDKLERIIYYSQLFVNAMWSIIFFIWKLRLFAIIWIILLVILVIYLIYLLYKKYKISAYLNIPYILWLLFATYLTIGIYLLN